MYELIYHSIAHKNLDAADIDDILTTARDFNANHDITGCLLFYNHRFIQLLEGDEQIVRNLFASIEKDKRHFSVQLMAVGNKAERMFDGWSMAFQPFGDSSVHHLERLLFVHNFTAFADLTEKPTEAVMLFFQLAKQLLKE